MQHAESERFKDIFNHFLAVSYEGRFCKCTLNCVIACWIQRRDCTQATNDQLALLTTNDLAGDQPEAVVNAWRACAQGLL